MEGFLSNMIAVVFYVETKYTSPGHAKFSSLTCKIYFVTCNIMQIIVCLKEYFFVKELSCVLYGSVVPDI